MVEPHVPVVKAWIAISKLMIWMPAVDSTARAAEPPAANTAVKNWGAIRGAVLAAAPAAPAVLEAVVGVSRVSSSPSLHHQPAG